MTLMIVAPFFLAGSLARRWIGLQSALHGAQRLARQLLGGTLRRMVLQGARQRGDGE
jgi:hypothetical protein